MRSVRSALVGLGTLTILLTFVGFAMFSPDGTDPRPEIAAEPAAAPMIMAADAGTTTGRVTAFVFANQLQGQIEPEVQTELTIALLVKRGRKPLSVTTTTQPPTTTTTVRRVTTTTKAPARTTTTAPATTTTPPATTTTTAATTTTTAPPAGWKLTENEMRVLVTQYFPAGEIDKAVLVARCESNYDPSASNPTEADTYAGLYQHSIKYWDARAATAGWAGSSVYDANANTAVSAWLVGRDGWNNHWPFCGPWADAQLGG